VVNAVAPKRLTKRSAVLRAPRLARVCPGQIHDRARPGCATPAGRTCGLRRLTPAADAAESSHDQQMTCPRAMTVPPASSVAYQNRLHEEHTGVRESIDRRARHGPNERCRGRDSSSSLGAAVTAGSRLPGEVVTSLASEASRRAGSCTR